MTNLYFLQKRGENRSNSVSAECLRGLQDPWAKGLFDGSRLMLVGLGSSPQSQTHHVLVAHSSVLALWEPRSKSSDGLQVVAYFGAIGMQGNLQKLRVLNVV